MVEGLDVVEGMNKELIKGIVNAAQILQQEFRIALTGFVRVIKIIGVCHGKVKEIYEKEGRPYGKSDKDMALWMQDIVEAGDPITRDIEMAVMKAVVKYIKEER